MQRNESTSSDGLERFFGETVKNLNFAMVADRMKLIEPDNKMCIRDRRWGIPEDVFAAETVVCGWGGKLVRIMISLNW